jgi:hypothetical protein
LRNRTINTDEGTPRGFFIKNKEEIQKHKKIGDKEFSKNEQKHIPKEEVKDKKKYNDIKEKEERVEKKRGAKTKNAPPFGFT